MRVLFDNNVPAQLRRHLAGHKVRTARQYPYRGYFVIAESTRKMRRLSVGERAAAVIALPRDNRETLMLKVASFLGDRSPVVREKALRIIADEVLFELEDQVIELLSDKNDFVRNLAIECLGEFHGGESVAMPFLYPFLKSPVCLTRVETMETLAWVGDRKALPFIVTRLEDDDYLVRSYAANAIAELKGGRYRKVIEAAAQAEQEERAKPWFARALFLLGDKHQFFTLISLLSSMNCTARCAAANALADIELSAEQTASALVSVVRAKNNFIARSDQSTMERVEEQLSERIEWINN